MPVTVAVALLVGADSYAGLVQRPRADWTAGNAAADAAAAAEFALLDLLGLARGLPVFRLAAELGPVCGSMQHVPPGRLTVGCYDTSLYIE